jgi:hypothetical protein
MKLKHAAVLLAAAFLAACGSGKQEGDVRFIGFSPLTSKDKDVRAVQTFCPNCKKPMEVDKARCDNKACKTDVAWPKDYKCPSCQGTGACAACTAMEQTRGECYNCRGQGVLIYAGKSPECPNCKGSKKCPICKDPGKCEYCSGTGRIPKEVVKAKAAKYLTGDNELPPSDARPPVPPEDKKDEKKEEPKKEEPKKEGASTEEKK